MVDAPVGKSSQAAASVGENVISVETKCEYFSSNIDTGEGEK